LEAEQIQELIDKYLLGQTSPEETTLVENWYESIDNQHRPDADRVNQYKAETHQFLAAYIRDARPSQLLPMVSGKPQFNVYRWLSAAIVVLGLSAALYFYSKPSAPIQVAATKKQLINDVAPGGNKAILTLSNGKQVVLTNAKNGIVATQGDIAINKTDDGKLIYNADQTIDQPTGDELTYNTIATPPGGIYYLMLADGTQVWLNAASSIKYPVAFKGSERVVELTGEAYFEVAKNKDMPFRVKSAGQTIEVLGTHFNINSYSNEKAIRTTLLEGSVKVSASNYTAMLKPGEQSVFKALSNKGIRVTNKINIDEVMAWKNGKFMFAEADIETVMRQLERWYDVGVVYNGAIPTDHFTGKIPKNVNLSQVLQVLELSGVHFTIEGRKIIIK
jgi:transmembrane sensor